MSSLSSLFRLFGQGIEAAAGARPRPWRTLLNLTQATPTAALFGRDVQGVVAVGRCVMGAVFLLVLAVGEPPGSATLIAISGVYLGLGVLGVVCAATLRRRPVTLLMLAADAAYGGALLLGGAPIVLFVMFYTFAVFASAALLGWRAALACGGGLLAAYVGAVGEGLVPRDRLLVRGLYMAAACGLVARAAHDFEVARSRLFQLARWSSGRFDPADDALEAALRHAAEILEAEGVWVTWRAVDDDGPGQALVWRAEDGLMREASRYQEEDAPAAVRGKPFILVDRRRQICLTYEGLHKAPGATPVAVLGRPGKGEVVASDCFSGRFREGRLFAFGIASWRWDQLVLVELVAKQVLARLEGRAIRAREAQAAAERERAEVARDLHDGILQNLTAARLMLRLAGSAPAREALADVSNLLRGEQEKLRDFVEARRQDESAGSESLERLAQIVRDAAARWRIVAHVTTHPPNAPIPTSLARELAFLLTEAVANAARHGGPGPFAADLLADSGLVELRLTNRLGADQGRLAAAPRSISDRVLALNGTLAVELAADLITFHIQLPTHPA